MTAIETKLPEDAFEPVSFEVIPADICLDWLTQKIYDARDRAVLQAMSVTHDTATMPVFDALTKRAQDEQFIARLVLDGYSFMFDDSRPRFMPTYSSLLSHLEIRNLQRELIEMSEKTVEVGVLNRFGTIGSGWLKAVPYANRNHIKGNAVDDLVTIAGPNLTEDSMKRYDFMLATEHTGLANFWDNFTASQIQHGRLEAGADFEHKIDTESSLLVDVGVRGRSVIYDTACSWLEDEDVAEVLFVNQFFPTGRILKRFETLQKSQGMSAVQVVTTHAEQFSQPARNSQRRRQEGADLKFETTFGERTVHTKVLIVTKTDGTTIGMITSNNFDERGINYGTAETALVTTNAATLKNVKNYCEQIPTRLYT